MARGERANLHPREVERLDKPRHGGHLVAETLRQEGVTHFFTLSGGHIAPIYDGCVDLGIEVVDFRHEQSAAHAADGWARVTLSVGVAGRTPGPRGPPPAPGPPHPSHPNPPRLFLP